MHPDARRLALTVALALLAGCQGPGPEGPGVAPTSPASPPATPPSFAPQTGHDEAYDESTPGVVVVGDLRPCDAGSCIEATARNDGPATWHVSDVCVPPWSESMERDGERVQHQEPKAYCAAFGTRPLAPGDTLEASFSWDGRLWDDGGARPAPGGAYTWTVALTLFEGDQGQAPHNLALAFTVVVGET